MDLAADVARISGLLPGAAAETGHVALAERSDPGPVTASAFDVDRLLAATAAFATASADHAASRAPAPRTLDLEHVAAYCTTHVEVDGSEVPAWADLSGLYETADGRTIQLHCNFPHHAEGVVARLGRGDERADVTAAIARWDAFDLERTLIDDGMIAAVVRTLDEWDAHPHALATASLPLVSVERIGDAEPGATSAAGAPAHGDGARDEPLVGTRVLDCSRVLAGPVAGSMLAGFGADVLRIGAAHLPSVPVGVLSTGFGKRNAFVDVRSDEGRAVFADLLSDTDVWIDAYRPGSFDRHGLTAAHAAELRPGIVVVRISAFDDIGPWGGRRGFDSIVQSTTGVRWAGGRHAAGAPGPVGLPVQALDYATGFLAAGVAAQLLAHQRREGGSWLAKLSLLRTRDLLVSFGRPDDFVPRPVDVDPALLHTVDAEVGALTTVRPFVGEVGTLPAPLGSSAPSWRDR